MDTSLEALMRNVQSESPTWGARAAAHLMSERLQAAGIKVRALNVYTPSYRSPHGTEVQIDIWGRDQDLVARLTTMGATVTVAAPDRCYGYVWQQHVAILDSIAIVWVVQIGIDERWGR